MGYKILDAHADTMGKILKRGERFAENSGEVRPDRMRQYDGYVQVFAAWVDATKPNPTAQALEIADVFYRETEENEITVIKNGRTLENVLKNGKMGAILALEDGAALGGSLGVLRMLYALGFRIITLCWNGENELGDGAADSRGRGLTPFGKEAVKEMEGLGMVVDVSHLSEKGFWDAMEITKKPIIASHSNARAICAHPRNLSDEQIREIAKCGGAVGVNLYPAFLTPRDEADVTDVIRHIEHILAIGGEDVLGFGTDFDGISSLTRGLAHPGHLGDFLDALARIGYGDTLLKKLAYGNFARVFGMCMSNSCRNEPCDIPSA